MKTILLTILMLTFACANLKPEIPTQNITVEIQETDKKVFSYKSSLKYIQDTARLANCVVNNKDFQKEVESIEKFDFTDDNGKQVIKKLLSQKCRARTYKTRNPLSKAVAKTMSNSTLDFYFNTRKNPRSYKAMVNGYIHECAHVNKIYSHGGGLFRNFSGGKQNSVNYKVGKISEKYVTGCL